MPEEKWMEEKLATFQPPVNVPGSLHAAPLFCPGPLPLPLPQYPPGPKFPSTLEFLDTGPKASSFTLYSPAYFIDPAYGK